MELMGNIGEKLKFGLCQFFVFFFFEFLLCQ